MVSLKKLLFRKELSVEDLSYLSKLLATNMPINNCIKLLKNRNNEKIFNQIEKQLNEGVLIEDAIRGYLPKQIEEYLLPLSINVSFNNALDLSLQFNEKHSNSQNKLLSEVAYPCILLFITITVLYLFDLYGMDTIFSLIGSFNADVGIYAGIRTIFRIVINIFYYGILIGVLIIIYFSQPKRLALLYLFFSRRFPNSLINIYYCEEFVSLLLTCVDKGYKSKESLTILKQMKTKPIVSFLAFHLDEDLLEGESMKEATRKEYYDSSLSRFIKIANYTNDFSNVLQSYTILAREKINKKIKKYTLTIQLTTYSFIGIIVVFIYQILFMPMQALGAY